MIWSPGEIAFAAGAAAYWEDAPRKDNPHPIGSYACRMWDMGWRTARCEVEHPQTIETAADEKE